MTDQLMKELIDGKLPLGVVGIFLLAIFARSGLKWAAANYWPKYVEWKEQRMSHEAAAEARQQEMLASAFKQTADLFSRSMELDAQHELNDEKRHHVVLERIDRTVGTDRHDERNRLTVLLQGQVIDAVGQSEQRIMRELRRINHEDSEDLS